MQEQKLTGYPSIDKPWEKYYSDEALNAEYPKTNMRDYLVEKRKNTPDFIAINYFGKRVKYRELFKKIDQAEKAFYNLGIRNSDTVSIAAPFFPEVIYSIYALNAIGAVVNIIDPRVPADKFLQYLVGSESKYLISIDSCYPKIKEIESRSGIESTVLISAIDSLPEFKKTIVKITGKKHINNVSGKYLYWDSLIREYGGKECSIKPSYHKNKPAIIIYTSGTSGEPKGAVASNETFNNIALTQSYSLTETKEGDKFLLIMPPFIAYGLAIGMHGQLCRGQELIMVPSFNIDNQAVMLGDLLYKLKPQTIMGVPAFMVDLTKHPKMQKLDCSFLKTIIVGGDSMIPQAETEVNQFFGKRNSSAKICKGWGLTEVNSAFSYTKSIDCNEVGSVGIPLVGGNIKVVAPIADDGSSINIDKLEELPYNEIGELFICSKSTILDYLNNPQESSEVFFVSEKTGEKWVRTKDLGRVTENGIIFIEGRMKRIIIRPDGHNISPFAIERIINTFEEVEACAVVGKKVSEHLHGAQAIAYIQLKKDYKGAKEELLKAVRSEVERQLPPRDVASEYVVIDEFPLTPIGKIDYRALEKQAEEMSKK